MIFPSSIFRSNSSASEILKSFRLLLAVSTAFLAASSQELGLVPISSMTLYTLSMFYMDNSG